MISWLGTIFYISAYFLLVVGKLSAQKSTYHVLNALGGICLIINAIPRGDSANIVVNGLWASMALFMVIKIWKGSVKISE